MSNSGLKRLLPLAIIGLALLLGSSMKWLKSDHPTNAKPQPSPVVDVMTVHFQPLQLYVNSQGTVSPRRSIAWASEVSGRVIWVSPELVEGGAVKAGMVLLRLDNTDYRVAVAEAKAALADAALALAEERAEFQRGTVYRNSTQAAKAPASSNTLRQPKLDQVEAVYSAAEEKLRQAQQDLSATEITAPYSGVIDQKQVDLGQYVTTGSTIFNLLSTDIAQVRLPVTAGDIGLIPVAAAASEANPTVTLTAKFGDKLERWQGSIVRMEQRVDTETRVFYAVAEVRQPYNPDNHSVPLSLGLFVEAQIEGLTLDRGLRLPAAAIHDNRFIFLVSDGRLKRRDITLFRQEHESVVVTDGLQDGDQVVVSKLDLMVNGMPVTPSVVNPEVAAVASQQQLQQHSQQHFQQQSQQQSQQQLTVAGSVVPTAASADIARQ